MKTDKKTLQKLEEIRAYRRDLFDKLLAKKLTVEDFANSGFMFLQQNKIKPIAKAHDVASVLLNYYYWAMQIERKVAVERQLIKLGVGSWEKFQQLAEVYIKRRDQMVRRLIWELNHPVKDSYMVFDDTIELILESGECVFSTKESLDKIKFKVSKIKQSSIPYYMPILNLRHPQGG